MLPSETTREKPSERSAAQSSIAATIAPDCDTNARSPARGVRCAKLALTPCAGAMKPMQLGPMMRMPRGVPRRAARARARRLRGRAREIRRTGRPPRGRRGRRADGRSRLPSAPASRSPRGRARAAGSPRRDGPARRRATRAAAPAGWARRTRRRTGWRRPRARPSLHARSVRSARSSAVRRRRRSRGGSRRQAIAARRGVLRCS